MHLSVWHPQWSVSHSQGHHSIAFIDCEGPGSNPGRQTVLRPQHPCCCLIVQIWVFSHKGCNATPCPSRVISCLDNSWLDSQPLWINCCSESRTPFFQSSQILRSDTGFLLRPATYWRRWYRPSKWSTELHPSTSKHWSDHTPQCEHLAPLHQLGSWYWHRWEQTKVAQQSHNPSVFWRLSGGMNSRQMSGQQNHSASLQKTLDSLVQTSSHPRIAWLHPHPPWKKKNIYALALVCSYP